jgi:DNA-binding Lrp family transcriptional regulator
MARKTGIPISTLYDKLKMSEKNYIKKHASLLDFQKLGFTCHAQVILKVDRDKRDSTREYLLKNERINALMKINNGYDFLAEVICANMRELEEFLEQLDQKCKILEKQVFYIIEEIAREKFLASVPETAATEI